MMRIEQELVDKMVSQVKHIIKFYEEDELEYKFVDLVSEWFIKGYVWGQKSEEKNDVL